MTELGDRIIARARSFRGRLHDGPDVVMMAQAIGQKYPPMAAYARGAGQDTPWCGIFNAYVHMLEGVQPAYSANGSDYDDFMWADAPVEGHWGTPVTQATAQPGDTVVLRVPHHITFLDSDNGDGTFNGTGGNQSEAGSGGGVTTSRFQWRNIRAVIRAPGASGAAAPGERPEIKLGSTGDAVREAQRLLGLPQSGTFDQAMDDRVRAYQASRGLDVDGEVGPNTWGALESHAPVVSSVPHAAEYRQQWDTMVILPEHTSLVQSICSDILGYKARYQAAEKLTRVPWYVIAAIHYRESTLDFTTQLAQGDPLDSVSTHVPAGRGPFPTWEAGAYDALVTLKHFDKVVLWSIEQVAYRLEQYNGTGYRSHGVPSAYLWSFSNIYRGGKYVADGPSGWSPTTFDKQCGTMVIIRQLMAMDSSIHLDTEPLSGDVIGPGEVAPPPAHHHSVLEDLAPVLLPVILTLIKERTMATNRDSLLEKLLPILLQSLASRGQARPQSGPTDVPPSTTAVATQDPMMGLLGELLRDLLHRDPPPPPPTPDTVGEPGENQVPSATSQAASVDLRTFLAGAAGYLGTLFAGGMTNPIAPGASLTSQLVPIVLAAATALGLPSWLVGVLKLAPAIFTAVGKAKEAQRR